MDPFKWDSSISMPVGSSSSPVRIPGSQNVLDGQPAKAVTIGLQAAALAGWTFDGETVQQHSFLSAYY